MLLKLLPSIFGHVTLFLLCFITLCSNYITMPDKECCSLLKVRDSSLLLHLLPERLRVQLAVLMFYICSLGAIVFWPIPFPRRDFTVQKNFALWIISVAFVNPFVVTYGCMHDMLSPAPRYYLLLHHGAKSSGMRKCRAEFMPGDTSSPWNAGGNQSHSDLEKWV